MRIVVGLGALFLALGTGYLALSTGTLALTLGAGAASAGQAGPVRGLIFAVVMAAATVGLLWVAAQSLGRSR